MELFLDKQYFEDFEAIKSGDAPEPETFIPEYPDISDQIEEKNGEHMQQQIDQFDAFIPDYKGIEVYPSPNFGDRIGFSNPDTIIIHYTAMDDPFKARNFLCDPEKEVSAHYLIHENGHIVQLVPEKYRAWHAGKSFWAGRTDINSCSIGIEISNQGYSADKPDFFDYTKEQMNAVIALCQDITSRYTIPPHHILGHSDIAPERKQDPGPKFDWKLLAQNSLGHYVPPACLGVVYESDTKSGKRMKHIQTLLSQYGYRVHVTGEYDEQTSLVITAFQRHYRPARVDGIPDESTIDTLERLVRTLEFPVCYNFSSYTL